MADKPKIRKVVLWDFDGPLNVAYAGVVPTGGYHLKTGRFLSHPGGVDVSDVVFSNPALTKLGLGIMCTNGVLSISATQRLIFEKNNPMSKLNGEYHQSLNEAFGKDRSFLLEEDAKKIGAYVLKANKADEINHNKNLYFKVAGEVLSDSYDLSDVKKGDMILIDDDQGLVSKAKEEDYGGIFVDKRSHGAEERHGFLYEVLTKTVALKDISKSLDEINVDSKTKMKFKEELRTFQFTNLDKVYEAQSELGSIKKNENLTDNQKQLTAMKAIISNTKWDLAVFGGTEIKDENGNKTRVPTNMAKIYNSLEAGLKNPQDAAAVLNEAKKMAAEALDKTSITRKAATTASYKAIRDMSPPNHALTQKAAKTGIGVESNKSSAQDNDNSMTLKN